MNGVPEEVKEDPNEQTYTEFPTKRTNQGKANIDYNTISSIRKILPGEEKLSHKNQDPQNNQSKIKKNKEIENEKASLNNSKPQIIVDSKIINFASIDKAAYYPDSKSVSLSFSSKHPDEDEINNRLTSNMDVPFKPNDSQYRSKDRNKIIQRMKFIKQGLDNLNTNLQKFEKDLLDSK